eukprot:6200382-Pleurochrysis_carterae.AAC.1
MPLLNVLPQIMLCAFRSVATTFVVAGAGLYLGRRGMLPKEVTRGLSVITAQRVELLEVHGRRGDAVSASTIWRLCMAGDDSISPFYQGARFGGFAAGYPRMALAGTAAHIHDGRMPTRQARHSCVSLPPPVTQIANILEGIISAVSDSCLVPVPSAARYT